MNHLNPSTSHVRPHLLNPLITNYLQKESIQLLLQKDKIIFGDDKLDITKEILKIFNEKHSKISFE